MSIENVFTGVNREKRRKEEKLVRRSKSELAKYAIQINNKKQFHAVQKRTSLKAEKNREKTLKRKLIK